LFSPGPFGIVCFNSTEPIFFRSLGGASAGEDGVAEVLEAAARLQADVLVSRSLHEDAGYVLQRVGLHRPALELFQQAALWNQCLSLAALLDFQ